MKTLKVVIKGAGDIATGVAHRLFIANIRQIVMTEISKPLTVRRAVAFSDAVYDGREKEVEGVTAGTLGGGAVRPEEVFAMWEAGRIALIVDPLAEIIRALRPDVVVDAIMAKRNTGTTKDEAPLVIGIGPGFSAPSDVHVVVESKRGHDLGRVFLEGSAELFTGVPGPVMGFTTGRLLRAPHGGRVRHVKAIGDKVKKGEVVLFVGETPVTAGIDGVLRGLIQEIEIVENEKVGDVDPRGERVYCYTISEKARAIGGGVLEAIMHRFNR